MTAGIAELIPGGDAPHEGIRKEPAEGTTAGSDPPFRRGPCCHDWGAQERKGIDECAERRARGARRGARKERQLSADRASTSRPHGRLTAARRDGHRMRRHPRHVLRALTAPGKNWAESVPNPGAIHAEEGFPRRASPSPARRGSPAVRGDIQPNCRGALVGLADDL
ncbi:hypothetical protein GCM10009574_041620 [Streptomyces asiaticus]